MPRNLGWPSSGLAQTKEEVIVLCLNPAWPKKAAKINAIIGKFYDQISHVVGRVRSRAPWKFIDAPLEARRG